MIRRTQFLKEDPLAINMTPMIDIIFILLIFFMVINSYSQVQFEDLTLPISQEGGALSEGQILSTLTFTFAPRAEQVLLDGEPVTFQEIDRRLALAREHFPDPSAVIRCDKDTKLVRGVGPLIDLCTRHGVRISAVVANKAVERKGP